MTASKSAGPAISSLTVGHVGLSEAGNLGDDLILIAAVRAIAAGLPGARVRHLSHGLPLDWSKILDRLPLDAVLDPVPVGRGVGQWLRAPRLFKGCSSVVFGGGGLLQTSHHPLRPYHWLRYLGVGARRPPAVAAGLGIGPLSEAWMRRLARGPRYFEQCWVRDDASLSLARQYGWDAQRCLDFVDADFLGALGLSPGDGQQSGLLGVALRAWPGLDEDDVARHIERVAERENIERAEFFVLESKKGTGPDVEFTETVRQRLRLENEVSVYNSLNLFEMLDRMACCSSAISMKLHAGVVWSFSGATTYPIIYAPKVAAHFEVPYQGLEILAAPVKVVVGSGSESTPSAHVVVRDWLQSRSSTLAKESALPWPSHLALGIRSDASQIARLINSHGQHAPMAGGAS